MTLPHPTRDDLVLREITGNSALLEQVFRLRVLAWRGQTKLPVSMESWEDPVDRDARHWAFLHSTKVVASVRLSLHDRLQNLPHPEVYQGVFGDPPTGPIAYYSRAAVHPDYRRLGLLTEYHEVCAEAAIAMQARCMISITGSVAGNRFVGPALLKSGFKLAGIGRPYQATPYEPESPPMIYIRWLVDNCRVDAK